MRDTYVRKQGRRLSLTERENSVETSECLVDLVGERWVPLDDLREMQPAGDPAKPRFPTGDELAKTAAVMRILGTAPSAFSINEIARPFRQGRQKRHSCHDVGASMAAHRFCV